MSVFFYNFIHSNMSIYFFLYKNCVFEFKDYNNQLFQLSTNFGESSQSLLYPNLLSKVLKWRIKITFGSWDLPNLS